MQQQSRLDELARRAHTTRSDMIRRLIDQAGEDIPVPTQRLSEDELVDILHEKARKGSTGAISILLRRDGQRDDLDKLIADVLGDPDAS